MYLMIPEPVLREDMCGITLSMFVSTFMRVYSPDVLPFFQSSSGWVCAFV